VNRRAGRRLALLAALLAGSGAGGWAVTTALGPTAAAESAPSRYVVATPTRILDTRSGGAGPVEAATTLVVATGRAGASAVGINIALTETAGPGFVTAWATGAPRPGTSVVNSSAAGQSISNFVVVPVAADGTFQLFTNASTHVVVDLMGAFEGDVPQLPGGGAPGGTVGAGGPTTSTTAPPATAAPTTAGSTTTAPPASARFDFNRGATWQVGSGSGKFGGTDRFAEAQCVRCLPAQFAFEFTGTQVALHGATAPHHGIAVVQVDGGPPVAARQHAPERQDDVEFFRVEGLPPGRHQVTVVVAADPDTGGRVVSVDRAVVDGVSVDDSVTGPVGPPP